MVNKPRLYCRTCNKEFDHLDPVWRCSCGGLLDLDFQVEFPLTAIRERPASLWRYREAIPVLNDKCIVTYDEGFTPLLPLTLYRKKVLVKQDHLFPTGSYKDRGASILISKLKEIGVREIVEDSSGNAGASIAAYAARGGIKCTIFVPKDTARSKKEQVKLYGASIDDSSPDRVVAAKRALEKARQTYYASHCWNPYFFQGTKTFIFEIWEQMGYRLPDTLLLPVGNGSLLIGVYIGCQDLLKAGLIDCIPKLIGIQAFNCAPLYHAWRQKSTNVMLVQAEPSIAAGIAIPEPVRGRQILEIIGEVRGMIIAVTDAEIKESWLKMGKMGFCVESTSAVVVAGLKKYLPYADTGENLLTAFTGHGLKYF